MDRIPMQIQVAQYRDVRSWLDLAAGVEWLFGAMLDSTGFYEALLRNVARGTAFCVRKDDGPPGAPLLGGLLFSPARPDRPECHIRWLAVDERNRRSGAGTALVRHTFTLVPPEATLSVITFGEDVPGGRPARRFYERLGFAPAEPAPNGPEGGSRQVYRRTMPRATPWAESP
jgi:GNAT superfamily N-acetyltransferase